MHAGNVEEVDGEGGLIDRLHHHRETLEQMRGRQGCDACARRDLVLREREPWLFDEGSETE
jgi:hypothetical protein